MDAVKALVRAVDPLTSMVVSGFLNTLPGIAATDDGDGSSTVDVMVVITEKPTSDLMHTLKGTRIPSGVPVVLIACEISRAELVAAVASNVVAVVPRKLATGDRIEAAVRTAARGGGVLPPTMLGELIREVERLQREIVQPRRQQISGFTPREIEVLRLLSEGLDTIDIGEQLGLSERAVKRVINGVTGRLNLRNRPHAVAYAMRQGVI